MKAYIAMLREEIIDNPQNHGYDIYNDWVLKVYDSFLKATKFCEEISGVADDESYEVKDISRLNEFQNLIGYVDEKYGHYSMYIIERDIE
jgi:hypothetical protein